MNPSTAPSGTVAIVGRPNVGKSAIFNRMAGRRISIVHDQPGVTRDRVSAVCSLLPRAFSVIDTGGIGGGADLNFAEQVETEAAIAMEAADLILFVVDGRDGMTPADQTIAATLHRDRSQTPILLVVNKLDHENQDLYDSEFAALGFDQVLPVSAAHGRGMQALLDQIASGLKLAGQPSPVPEGARDSGRNAALRIAIVGKPNAGKSSLVNAILKDDRTIVSDIAGTTRDAVDIPHSRDGNDYVLIDTAGIRKKTKRDSTVEVFSAMRTEKSIFRAHICLLVVDSATGITAQDRKIARMVLAAHKPCIVVLNKFDLYHPDSRFKDRLESLKEDVGTELFFLGYAPMVGVSALKRDFINRVFKSIEEVRAAAAAPPSTGELNRMLERAMLSSPPPARKTGQRMKLLYATLAKKEVPTPMPVPRFVLFVNKRSCLTENYKRYLEREIRKTSPFLGLPIVFDVRERGGKKPNR